MKPYMFYFNAPLRNRERGVELAKDICFNELDCDETCGGCDNYDKCWGGK